MKINITKVDELIRETLSLLENYKKVGLTIPFSLKGNIGELEVYKRLQEKFPNSEIEFSGGARPSYDILFDGKKIQVKTKFVEREKYALIEGCPTIKRKIIEEKMCDFIILVEVYASKNLNKIDNIKIYIFNQNDFKLFSTVGCWSGNSKGDFTLWKVLEVSENAPKGMLEKIKHYNTEEYKELFNQSEDNWNKLIVTN